jgi:hypothetical protein
MHAPSQTAAASSKLMSAGLWAIGELSRLQASSACAPNPPMPKTRSPDGKLGDGIPDGFDLPGELHAQNRPPRPT